MFRLDGGVVNIGIDEMTRETMKEPSGSEKIELIPLLKYLLETRRSELEKVRNKVR